jgi:hypothetical protein
MANAGVPAKWFGLFGDELSAWGVALAALVAGGLLTAALAIATQSFYKQQLRQRFELLAGERYSRIAERFEEQEQRLDGLRRFFDFSNEITPREFDGYARRCCTAPRPIPGRRGWKQGSVKFEQRASDLLAQRYQIRDQDAQGGWQAAPRATTTTRCCTTRPPASKGSPMAWTCSAKRAATLARAGPLAAWRCPSRWTCSASIRPTAVAC